MKKSDKPRKGHREQNGSDINKGMKVQVKRYANVVAVSGGVDSVYLLLRTTKGTSSTMAAHYNHKARGKDSEEDERFVETFCRKYRMHLEMGGPPVGSCHSPGGKDENGHRGGFEARAREERYRFLLETKERYGAKKILVAHTADDQVETILMRIMEGAGISGLKGIPRTTAHGIERPLLDTWREDILEYLKKHAIPYREDRSNRDTRFERNWVRHVLLPLLEKRYGKSVKRRIFTLGERFREIDVYIEDNTRKWLKKYSIVSSKRGAKEQVPWDAARLPRKAYAGLPSIMRMRILQILCFERLSTSPNERLLASMDRLIVSGGPSAKLSVGKGSTLRCRYGEAILSPRRTGAKPEEKSIAEREKGRDWNDRREEEGPGKGGAKREKKEPVVQMKGPGRYLWKAGDPGRKGVVSGYSHAFLWEERGKTAQDQIRLLSEDGQGGAFDGEKVAFPLSVRPLKAGDQIRPFGLKADKKVKEILIDRKVPRDERWGRPVVCDSRGEILWIPGVIRSSHAPVTPKTRRTIVLRTEFA